MKTDPIRMVETNAAGDETDATVWGIRVELLWVALGGVAISAMTIAALIWSGNLNLWGTVIAAAPGMVTLSFAWFRMSHPPGYDSDLLDLWWNGPGFGPKPPSDESP